MRSWIGTLDQLFELVKSTMIDLETRLLVKWELREGTFEKIGYLKPGDEVDVFQKCLSSWSLEGFVGENGGTSRCGFPRDISKTSS